MTADVGACFVRRYACADTMSHHAPIFSERQGYDRVGFLPDWESHGHDRSFFRKSISPA